MRENEQEFSFKNFFTPLTTLKAIHIIIVVGIIVFFNVFFNNFVWDDLSFIVLNPDTHSLNILKLFGQNIINIESYYRPIPALYYAIFYNVFGSSAFFYHFFQVVLHIVSTCLLFLFLRKFLKITVAFFLSLIFLIHPIQVESVVWISAIQFYFFFGLFGLLLSTKEKISVKNLFLISLFLLLSLLSKETGFLFFLLILFFQELFYKKRLLTFFFFELATLALYIFIRFVIGGIFFSPLTTSAIDRVPLLERFTSIPAIIFYYIKTFFFPERLIINQQWIVSHFDMQHFFLPLLIDIIVFLIISIIGFSVYKTRKEKFKIYLFFCLWIIIGILPIIQIFPLNQIVADRWFYFPLAGLLGVIGIGLSQINLEKNLLKTVSLVMIIAIIVVFSVRTFVRNQNWYTGLTLYGHDVPLEQNYQNEHNYAIVLSYDGQHEQAIEHHQKSVELYPLESNLRDLGSEYFSIGKKQLAKDYFYKALQAKSIALFPHAHEEVTYGKLARLELVDGDIQEAKHIAEIGVKDYPDSPSLWLLVAISEYKLNNYQEALLAAEKAYQISPDQQNAYALQQIKNNEPISINSQ